MADIEQEGGSLSFFLVGVGIGALFGVLFAPRQGRETREQISDWMRQQRERSAEAVQHMREKLPSKERLTSAYRQGKENLQEAAERTVGS